MSNAERRLSAILSADAVGYSRLVSRDGVLATRRIGESRERIGRLVAEHAGRVVDAVGDNLLSEFRSAAEAVACAVAIQADLGRRNAEVEVEARLPFRIGVEIGDVLVEGDRVTGDCVNVAARLEALAPVGGLAISGTVRDQLAGRIGLELRDLGEWRLHNIPRPVLVLAAELGGGEAPPGAIEGNLPASRTSFVGRERACEELACLLARERLVTLTGLGGAGKTRLALEVARNAAASFDGGTWWVELQALSDEEQVAGTIANAVAGGAAPGLAGGGATEEQIARAIGQRRTLLVLDNCEHIVDACAELSDTLLSRCTMLTILATSREPLEVTGERVWQVAPLEVPGERIALADAEACEAIALFLDRARAARADFALSGANLASVQQICAHLDGIPLAIELAAVRVRHLPPEEIASRLDDRFRLLVARRRRSERRHQTLQAALDWSHDLLDEPSRALFRRLSVFAGRFGLDAVEGICGGVPAPAGEALEVLGGLVDRSFVSMVESTGEARYRLLETVREYAARKLEEAGEHSDLRARHADWFARWAVAVGEELFAGRGSMGLWGGDAVAAEVELLDDLVLANEWAHRQGAPSAPMLPIVTVALLRVAGRTAEALSLAARVDGNAMDDRERALLDMGVASAHNHLGDFASAYDVLAEVVERARAAGWERLAVAALANQLIASFAAGKEPAPIARQILEAMAGLDDAEVAAVAETSVGAFHLIEGRFAEASPHFSNSVRRDSLRPSLALGFWIVSALLSGDQAGAAEAARHAKTLAPPATALARANYGWNPMRSVALFHAWTGDLDEARRVESRALAYQAEKPMPLADADHLVTLAAIAFFDANAEYAARLLGAARRAMGVFRSWRGHDAGPLYLYLRGRCHDALGREAAERLRGEGLASDPAAILAEARRGLALA
jgi:predicted ATPase/class 3 adenylate cyclase